MILLNSSKTNAKVFPCFQLVTKYPMLLEARMQQIDLERRDTRERGQNYKAKALTEELVAVQRLAILVPANSSE